MKRGLWIMVLLVALPMASAQLANYNNYSTLVLNTQMSSSVFADKGNSPRIDTFSVNLTFFPINEGKRQLVERLDVSATPQPKVTSKEDYIEFFWKDPHPREDLFKFGVDAEIKTLNEFQIIRNKKPFPLVDVPRDVKIYMQPSEFIDINDNIRNKANEIIAGETDYYVVMFKLAQWVENNIQYNLSSLTEDVVQKSSWVLENKQGVCDELTSLYISMLRAVGVPARFVGGQVYSNIDFKFGNHGWAEVFYPGEGWVPVDVTFGQVGWIDPSHIKFKDSIDSANPDVKYSWMSRDVVFRDNPLTIKTEVVEGFGTPEKHSSILIEPIKKQVGPGSYVPVMATIVNPNSYYVPMQLSITLGPKMVGQNRKSFLLRPLEETRAFWIFKIPEDLEEGTVYKTTIRARTNFGRVAETEIKYDLKQKVYDEEWARKQVESMQPDSEKEYFPNVKINCNVDKPYYYETQIAELSCDVKNVGNQPLINIEVCYLKNCKIRDLGISEEKKIEWDVPLSGFKDDRILVTAKTKNMAKTAYTRVEIIEVPNLTIKEFGPKEVSYYDSANMSFLLETDAPARNIRIIIEGFGEVTLPKLETTFRVVVPFQPKEVLRENINIIMVYEDIAKKEYTKEKKFKINIIDKPWYIKFLLWLENYLN